MSIRKKLMILLLFLTLVPLAGTIIMYQVSINQVVKGVSSDIREVLDENARNNMQRILNEYETMLHLNARLVESLVQNLVVEAQKSLKQPASSNIKLSGNTIGLNAKLEKPDSARSYFVNRADSIRTDTIYIDFKSQVFYLVDGKSNNQTRNDLSQLAGLTEQYNRIYKQDPQFIVFIHTSLKNGVHTRYPSGGQYPENYDPRTRIWYTMARDTGKLVWTDPYIDASTREPMITVAAPIYVNSAFAGVTGIDILLSDTFQWLKLYPDWAEGAEAMLLAFDEGNDDVKIFARMNYENMQTEWNQTLELESLTSSDKEQFAAFMNDMRSGSEGIRRMNYKGEDALWVYTGLKEREVYPLMIVPYDNLIEFADITEAFLLGKNLEWLRYTILFVILVVLIVVVVSIIRAGKFTKPIGELAAAGQKLAAGDFSAEAKVKTGDELEQFANLFNDIGPKLEEHQKMQHSLELAREIQQRLLPKEIPDVKNFDISGMTRYCDETGGDYYDFICLDEIEPGKMSIVLGDVTGHGIGAALLMASARSMLRNNVRHYSYDLSKVMYEFNNDLTTDTDSDKFITLFYAILDIKKKNITWSAGGHDPALLIRADSEEIIELKSDGIPMGFMKDMQFGQDGPFELKSGDIILVGTDGIWEAENQAEEMYGKKRLISLIREYNEKPATEICQKVIDAVVKWTAPVSPDDDITVVIVKTE